ncbi:MAG TPA: DUF1572 family protein [Vicinamibacterales bacterium]|nr:DUF1572 family protein [Vicinamibacterales bacterium]
MSSPIVETTFSELRKVKRLADQAIEQLDDEQLWTRIDPESNSVAVVMRHMAGNMRSRWTDFRTTDGEKPDRHRDQEFEDAVTSRSELLAEWDDGWRRVFDALSSITDADLQETIYIREEPHTIHRAIVRQIVHYAGHTYQILALGKHLKGPGWRTLSIPRGTSEAFNQRMLAERRARR